MNTKIFFNLILGVLLLNTSLFAQQEKEQLKQLFTEDRTAIETIVLYPEDIRIHILEVSMHPELLIKLSGLQKQTEQRFQKNIGTYPQEQQAKFYELSRYPGLTKDLVANGKLSKSEINQVLEKYPEEIHETAVELGRKEFETLQRIYQLNISIKQSFSEVLNRYPAKTQESTKALVKMPEVLTILVDNIDQTILVGDIYKNDPEWVEAKAKELNLEVARKQAEELEDYKKQLEQDPEAYQEMLEAAELYAKDNDIDASKDKKETTTEVKVTYNYPYWYGYPYWYTYPMWRPVPYYYHTGFYIGTGGVVVVIGLPSYHYVHWHYTYYPHMHVHLHAHYHRHYRRHPHGHGGFHAAVNINVNKNVNLRKGKPGAPNKPGKRQTVNPKIDNKNLQSRDFDRFRASDQHRGNWAKKNNKGFAARKR